MQKERLSTKSERLRNWILLRRQ